MIPVLDEAAMLLPSESAIAVPEQDASLAMPAKLKPRYTRCDLHFLTTIIFQSPLQKLICATCANMGMTTRAKEAADLEPV